VLTGVGFVLFLVPGLIAMTRWSLIAPAIVLERRGPLQALRRSSELVRGDGFSVFVVVLAVSLIGVGLAYGADRLFAGEALLWRLWLGALLVHAVVTPFAAHARSVVYYDLREI